jgi:hypothetical protein
VIVTSWSASVHGASAVEGRNHPLVANGFDDDITIIDLKSRKATVSAGPSFCAADQGTEKRRT